MIVYDSVEAFPGVDKAIVTIGTFDGVHAGHQQIIRKLRALADREGGQTLLLTFFPHPRMVLQPDEDGIKLITTMEERKYLLEKYGIDHLIIQSFSKEFSRMSATEFVRDVLINRIGTKTLVIGYDHHFGRNREGTFRDLEELSGTFGYRLQEIPKQMIDEVAVSSTKIRNALLEGDVATANKLMGHDFTLCGEVVRGDQKGSSIGFPTANIRIPEPYKLIPAQGIYAALTEVRGVLYKGMLYIGTRPVVHGTKLSIEVNLFDFNQDIYGETIRIAVKAWIRNDMPLKNLAQLEEKLREDRINATKLLS